MTTVEAPPTAPALRGERAAGRLLARAGVALGLWVLLGSVLVVPLALAHIWRPGVVLPVLLVAAAFSVRLVRALPAPPAPVWAVALVVAAALGGALWAGATHAEHVVLRRDAGTYALSGQHLATAHRLDVDVSVAALGGPAVVDLAPVTVGSPGFFEVGEGTGTHVVPQFLPATPAWLSVGYWLGGWTGLLLVPAFALGAALLAFGALCARLIGPRWSAVATAALALCQPVLHAGRSTYSEPFALVVLLAGLVVLAEATVAGSSGRWQRARRLGLLAGLVLGGVGLVRVDALREVALLIPVCALLAIRRHGAGAPLALGLGISTVVGAAWAAAVSRPYLGEIAGSLLPLGLGAVVIALVSLLWWWLARRGTSMPDGVRRRLPGALAGLVLLAAVALTSRPLWLVVRQDPDDPGSRVVAGLQLRQGLTVDGGRTYAEQTVAWLGWWVGVPVLLLALAGAVLLAYRAGTGALRGRCAGVAGAVGRGRRLDRAHPLPAGHHPRPPVGRPAARAGRAARGRAARHRRRRPRRASGAEAVAGVGAGGGGGGRSGCAAGPSGAGQRVVHHAAVRARRGGRRREGLRGLPAWRGGGPARRSSRERVDPGAARHLLGALARAEVSPGRARARRDPGSRRPVDHGRRPPARARDRRVAAAARRARRIAAPGGRPAHHRGPAAARAPPGWARAAVGRPLGRAGACAALRLTCVE